MRFGLHNAAFMALLGAAACSNAQPIPQSASATSQASTATKTATSTSNKTSGDDKGKKLGQSAPTSGDSSGEGDSSSDSAATAPAATNGPVGFDLVKPILDQNCISCHNPNGDNPDLTTYAKARIVGQGIVRTAASAVVTMPRGANELTDSEKQILQGWKSNGFAETAGTNLK